MNPISEEQRQALLNNKYVYSVHENKIFYTPQFYEEMYDRMAVKHMTAVEAYESLGFKVDELGVNRADQAGKHAKERHDRNASKGPDFGEYDGSAAIEPDMLEGLSPDDKVQLLMARCAYLEMCNEFLKKKRFIAQRMERTRK